MKSVVVICQSNDDGESTAYGPFEGMDLDAAVAVAKRWLRQQPCRPSGHDPFWRDPNELHDLDVYSAESGTSAHWVSRLER